MKLIAAFSDAEGTGSVYLKRDQTGNALVFLDGKYHHSIGRRNDADAIAHTERVMAWGSYGARRSHYTRTDIQH